MLEGMVSDLSTWGTTWWRGTACAYPLVQEWIGWCPQPSICDYVPDSLASLCELVAQNTGHYVTPLMNASGASTAVYGTLALSSAYLSWRLYQSNKSGVQEDILQEINHRLLTLQTQVSELNDKFDQLTPKEQIHEIDLVKRARAQLEAYMKQKGVSNIFYGDKIREMGLEILEKGTRGESLFSTPTQAIANEEARMERILEARNQETVRPNQVSAAYSLHGQKGSEGQRQELLAEIKSINREAKPKRK